MEKFFVVKIGVPVCSL